MMILQHKVRAPGGRRSLRVSLVSFCLWVFLLSLPAAAGIIDRIAVTVDNQAITLSQVLEEIRVTAFLNGEQPDFSAASKRKTAERMVEQALIRHEMEFNRYQMPTLADTDSMLKQVKDAYSSDQAYQDALRRDGITEAQVRQHLLWQVTTLRFIDYRFRPGIQIVEQDMEDYYNAHRQELERGGKLPPLDQVRGQIEDLLKQQRIDQALDRWLGEARTQAQISYKPEAFL